MADELPDEFTVHHRGWIKRWESTLWRDDRGNWKIRTTVSYPIVGPWVMHERPVSEAHAHHVYELYDVVEDGTS